MAAKQGDLSLLSDPLAQQLLQSQTPARLAYVWTDGTPRVIPMGFHWNGTEIIMGAVPTSPKTKVLNNAKVAITIDTNMPTNQALLVRGTASVAIIDGVAPEYVLAAKRYNGEEAAEAWLTLYRQLFSQMARIVIKPEWVGILDFEKRFPSSIEEAMATTGTDS